MFLTPCCEGGGGGGKEGKESKHGKHISKCTRNIKNPLFKKSRKIQLSDLEMFSTEELKTKDTRKKNSLSQWGIKRHRKAAIPTNTPVLCSVLK